MKKGSLDKSFFFSLAVILLFGLLMVYDSTAVYAQGVLGGGHRLVLLHLGWLFLGLFMFFLVYRIDYHLYRKFIFPAFLIAAFFLVVLAGISTIFDCDTEVIFAPCKYGARRWLLFNPPPLPSLPFIGVLGFQPSELMKLALVVYLAVLIDKNRNDDTSIYIVTIVVSSVVALLVLAQPNMSTAALLAFIGVTLYFVSNASIKPMLVTLPIFGILGGLLISVSSYRRQRLLTFIEGADAGDSLTTGYHIKQILISLGSGGFWGLGIGQSIQKFNYLPEIYADSIFAIVGEELGFVGTTLLVLTYTFFIYKGLEIAKNAPDLLGRLLVVGVISWITYQYFINIAAMVKFIPLTGMPLPLVSYGGSSTVFSLIGLGIVANVFKQSRNKVS